MGSKYVALMEPFKILYRTFSSKSVLLKMVETSQKRTLITLMVLETYAAIKNRFQVHHE